MHATRYAVPHALLASLPVREVTTTNYDRLFEAAAEDAGSPVSVLPYERVKPGGRWLLKLHGTTEHPEDIVITREDYLDYPLRRGALRGLVQGLLITKHMLFIGFSLQDENFIGIAHDVRVATHGSSRARRRFGTVLTLFPDEVRRRLWHRDLSTIAIDSKPEGDQTDESRRRAARRLAIFLDRVAFRATPATLYLLDRTYEGVLGPDEKLLREQLQNLGTQASQVSPDSAAWRRIRTLLAEFGANENR
ncbi:hypothetical protein AYO39_00250 [Actinobacteria bacterium SCGC AG-212-D09]|nr:hypothetical protein AYO39_00250 [Actinobacteria bacterium SCGC AG-212-D09]